MGSDNNIFLKEFDRALGQIPFKVNLNSAKSWKKDYEEGKKRNLKAYDERIAADVTKEPGYIRDEERRLYLSDKQIEDVKSVIKELAGLAKQEERMSESEGGRQKILYDKVMGTDRRNTYRAGAIGLAHGMMRDAIKEGDLQRALLSYQLYEAAGKGTMPYAIQGLVKATKRAIQNIEKDRYKEDSSPGMHSRSYVGPERMKTFLPLIREIIQKNGPRAMREQNLESRLVTASLTSVLISLFFLSGNLTGNVVGSSFSSNVVGAILFVTGIFGFSFFFKRNRF